MKCELFLLRSNAQEVEAVNLKIGELISSLNDKGISLLYKTEIDLNPSSVEKALINSADSQDPPELIIIANAIDTKDKSSFINLFELSISNADTKQKSDTVIHTLGDLGNGYQGYYFTYSGIGIIVLPQLFLCGNDIISISATAVAKAQKYFESSPSAVSSEDIDIPVKSEGEAVKSLGTDDEEIQSEITDEETNNKKKKKKKGFWKSVFPQRGDRPGVVVSKILVIVFSIVFVVAGYLLIDDLVFQPAKNKELNNTLQNLFIKDNQTGETNTPSNPYGIEFDEVDLLTKDWDSVKAINSDICGWVRVKNLPIDYPVLYSDELDGNDFYYLYHDYEKNSVKYGSIFLDPRTASDLNSKAMVLHGHHMRDGSMFASLVDYGGYSGNLDTFKNSSIITLENPEGISKWQIFAVIKTTVNLDDSNYFDFCKVANLSDEEFMQYVYDAKIRSLFNAPVPINETDRLLVLSTCSYEYNNFRTIVFARELRAGEGSIYYTNNTTLNPRPLWSDDYYTSTGASRPSYPKKFEDAYKNGEITWYDGDLYK